AALAEAMAADGAAVLGISPVHAQFPADPNHFGPYGPSSRLFLNILHIDVETVPEFSRCEEARRMVASPSFRDALEKARRAPLVDYKAVSDLKLPVLAALYRQFTGAAPSGRTASLHAFRAEMGQALRQHALFDALHEHFFTANPQRWSWRTWPEAYQDCRSPAVAAFA